MRATLKIAFGTTIYKVMTFTSVAERSVVRGAVTPVLLRFVVARISKLDLLTIIQ